MSFELYNPARNVRYYAVTQLGEGGFGSVWSGTTQTRVPVAIKIIMPTGDIVQDLDSWNTDQHVHLLCWDHPHVVKTLDQFVSPEGYPVPILFGPGIA